MVTLVGRITARLEIVDHKLSSREYQFTRSRPPSKSCQLCLVLESARCGIRVETTVAHVLYPVEEGFSKKAYQILQAQFSTS